MFSGPSGSRGVFGLSGGELWVPTLERPENICCMPARTLLTPGSEGRVVDGVVGERLDAVCCVGGMVGELSVSFRITSAGSLGSSYDIV